MEILASRYNFNAYLGADFTAEMQYLDDENAPIDLSDYAGRVIFMSATGQHMLTLSKAASTLTLDGSGNISFALTASKLVQLNNESLHIKYLLTLTPPTGSMFPLLSGRLIIN